MSTPRWVHVCALDDIYPDSGVCALIDGRQVALFRVSDGVHAVGNHDPISDVNVLARGIVGDSEGELVVASPIYKQHFSLVTGRCLEEPDYSVPVYLARISSGEVWVRAQPVSVRGATGVRQLVVVGDDLAAMRTLEELVALAPHVYEISVFGAEPSATDNRSDEIVTHPPEWFAQYGITVQPGDPVERIDRVRRRVHARSGIEVHYDRLLIATGSRAQRLPVPGNDLPGVVAFRDLRDVAAMLGSALPGQPVVVIGGGLLGLEAAAGLAGHGMDVTVVHVSEYLMNRQLDNHASSLLRRELEDRGIKFRLAARAEAIEGVEGVRAVRLTDGVRLPATLVVMAADVTPNIDLAQAAGLRCDRGILVNDTLQTFDPAVYAVGECVQHRERTFGLVGPLWDQARVCAAYLAERGVRRYGGSRVSTHLKVSGIRVFSAGDFNVGTSSESLVMRDPKRGIYKHLLLEGGKIRGAVLYGDTADSGWYFNLINEGRDVGAMRDQLLFGEPAAEAGAV